jgi:hypothetical protein
MAVGYTGGGSFAEEWNGESWTSSSVQQPSDGAYSLLLSVTCPSVTNCEAVGQDGQSTLAEQWNGTAWTIVPSQDGQDPPSSLLSSVSCIDASDCWAVGSDGEQTLAEEFSGSQWSIAPTPSPSGSAALQSVSCASLSFCEATGTNWLPGPQGGSAGIIETWDGSNWSAATIPLAAVAGQNNLVGYVDCFSETACMATASDSSGSFVLDYENGTWLTASGPPEPPGFSSGGYGLLSCVPGWACVAAGTGTFEGIEQTIFAEYPLQSATGPVAVISSPSTAASYKVNQVVPTAFSCFDGTGAPGIASCTDSNGSSSPGVLDTSTYGPHTYTVTATSADGQSSKSTLTYWVANPPTVTIGAPIAASDYIMSQSVPTSFACSDGTGGPGISTCSDSNGSSDPGILNTQGPGINTYTVTATSIDGLTTTSKVVYNVIGGPTVYIDLPTQATTFALGQTISASYSCNEYPGGPGIASCSDSQGSTNPQDLDTSSVGQHTLTATATSLDGLTATESFAYTVEGAPTATISSPASGATYAFGQIVPTTFECTEGAGGPGVNSCVDSNKQTSPGTLITTSAGVHTYSVEATSLDGLYSEASISYRVADPPTAIITSPASGGTYTLHQSVPTAFTCTEGSGGSGLSSCVDSNNQASPGLLDTSSLGPHTYTVAARSSDGLSGQTSITYTVVAPKVAPSVTLNPTSQTGYVGTTLTFTANATGVPAPTVQWQVSTNKGSTWVNDPGMTSTGLTTESLVTAENGWEVRAVFTNSAGTATTSAAKVTVLSDVAPKVSRQPANETVKPGGIATFTTAASGDPAPTVQWEVSVNEGKSWTNIAGATMTTISVSATSTQNGWRYRAVFTNGGGSVTTQAATLNVT